MKQITQFAFARLEYDFKDLFCSRFLTILFLTHLFFLQSSFSLLFFFFITFTSITNSQFKNIHFKIYYQFNLVSCRTDLSYLFCFLSLHDPGWPGWNYVPFYRVPDSVANSAVLYPAITCERFHPGKAGSLFCTAGIPLCRYEIFPDSHFIPPERDEKVN